MNRLTAVRLGVLYLPVCAAMLAGYLRPRRTRIFPALLLSLLWVLCSLLILQRLNLYFDWWSFAATRGSLLGMPAEIYLGWAIWWGAVPQLVFRSLSIPGVAVLMAALDLGLMPFCAPLLQLHRLNWLGGELVAVLLVLLPALCIARWTLEGTHLPLRATLQVAISGMLFLLLVPEIVFALRHAAGQSSVWQPLLDLGRIPRQIALQGIFLIAVPGISAVFEFVERGHGTPLPYDPPSRLVISGIYRYCANPMQLSCSIVMLLWALLLRNPWLVLAAVMSTVYSAGIAHWDEHRDLAARFGDAWETYHKAVPSWQVRWHPFHQGTPARLYVAGTCGPCSEVRRWIENRRPVALDLIDAETLPQGSILRLRYVPADGSPASEGLVAFARTLEHLHLGWAYCGITLRLPGFREAFQGLLDVSGFHPRTIPSRVPGEAPVGCENRRTHPHPNR
ncbi:MAG TPA: methyltransferase [Acidobacteriaceae bacterium]|jgi:protein-S-isoprenylcysteine O-methyltransferase Ste14